MPNSFLSEAEAKELVKLHGSPLMVIKRQKLVEAYNTFRELLPRVGIYYAMKANPHPEIVKTFADIGSSFDVASKAEIEELLQIGVPADKMIFANPVKPPISLDTARENHVEVTTFDSVAELEKTAKYHPRSKVVIRLKVPNVDSLVDLSLKFGAEPSEAVALMQKAKQLGLIPMGVSFHVGSQCINTVNYGNAIELSVKVYQDCKAVGIPLSLLDIGGGFPLQYLSDVPVPTIQDVTRKINHSLEKHFSDKRIKIIAEPGRYLAGGAVNLITTVVGTSTRNGMPWYTLSDGIYGSYSGTIFDHANYAYLPYKTGDTFPSVLAGPSCDSLDVMSSKVSLPRLELGDIVVTPVIGAYSSAHATRFNGIPLAKYVVI